MTVKLNKIMLGFVAAGLAVLNSTAFAKADDAASNPQKSQIESVVHDYIIKNPDVLVQSLQVYQQNQMQQTQKLMEKTQQNSPKFAEALFRQAGDPVIGNANGKVTIVEFFDYQCPHCVDMAPVLEGLVKTNPNLRIVLKDFPIRGPQSEMAAKAAIAANLQGKYIEMHRAIMESKKQLTEDTILDLAKSAGLDVAKLKADMKGDAVNQQIKMTYKLAQNLQLLGTPAIFIAKTGVTKNAGPKEVVFIPGQVDQVKLQELVDKIGK